MAQAILERGIKELIVQDGLNRKIKMNCAYMNCDNESVCISEGFKHFEEKHNKNRLVKFFHR